MYIFGIYLFDFYFIFCINHQLEQVFINQFRLDCASLTLGMGWGWTVPHAYVTLTMNVPWLKFGSINEISLDLKSETSVICKRIGMVCFRAVYGPAFEAMKY